MGEVYFIKYMIGYVGLYHFSCVGCLDLIIFAKDIVQQQSLRQMTSLNKYWLIMWSNLRKSCSINRNCDVVNLCARIMTLKMSVKFKSITVSLLEGVLLLVLSSK